MTIPCYVNITLNQVIQTNNNTYDKYIVKSGENGIIKVPTTRIINITIPGSDKTFTFTGRKANQKSTGINDNHVLFESICSIMPIMYSQIILIIL